MKMCSDCNTEMIENCTIDGQHSYDFSVNGRSYISVHIPTNEKGSFLGIKYDKTISLRLKARVCPNCGKVELYTTPKDETK